MAIAEISTIQLPNGETLVYSTSPNVVIVDTPKSPYGFTGVVDRAWIEAAGIVGRQYTNREIESGWPLAMEPHRLANIQCPQDSVGQNYVNTALLTACKKDQLQCHSFERHNYSLGSDGRRELFSVWTDYAIAAQDFAAWLAQKGEKPSVHIAAWFKAVGVRTQPETAPAQHAAAPVADSASNAPAWTVTKPQRYSGYAAPLHRFLAAAHREGKPRPTARDVLEAWRSERPAGIAKVLADGFDYFDANGDEKAADLEAIRKAIGRMTSAR